MLFVKLCELVEVIEVGPSSCEILARRQNLRMNHEE